PQSDIDIVVKLKKQDLFDLIGIKQDLEDKFHTHVDLVSYRNTMDPYLKKKIDQEAIYV
ncbi:MAG: nucleotidyltransferase family protein, partial [Thermodesulfobacteriota bacterium]